MEIDWNDYVIEKDYSNGRRYIYHDVKSCPTTSDEGLLSLQEFIDWALEHHETCTYKEN